ncbi:AAA family ATPase [Variovorax sp. J22G21]|uniref:AAA family ATPase n=1 Tax=Variovorax fucosicus TaxID=3053517 RepID=UPI002577AF22|nr:MULTISPECIES: AAA family ATPase [unclassified Variovorax]MDM0041510.1 AAA family ATPase [Variovorax sp. J22R193]MDM0060566.1 AAA family ATPase [Variovorax sp. J22G21]
MFVQSVKIENINGVKSLHLPLQRHMNLICGPNGIGKSTVLDSIAATFSHGAKAEIKRFLDSGQGKITVEAGGKEGGKYHLDVKNFHPTQEVLTGTHGLSTYIFSLKTNRTFTYEALDSISKDPTGNPSRFYQAAQVGISLRDTKNWFVNRFLYSAHHGSLNEAQLGNLELAKRCFSLLNPAFTFATVQASSNEIMVDTPTGQIYYEYLSSGFKSCLSIMFGLMKEIEYRFPNAKAEDFEGVVLVDEIELHLHPEWQAKIAGVLHQIFRSMQFIASTHSPHVIQNAEPDTVIALESVDGNVSRRDLSLYTGTFKGWTVEEVLEEVMGMPDTRTALFNELASEFGEAIDREDVESALPLYGRLDSLLHPRNAFRKIARLQLASIGVKLD